MPITKKYDLEDCTYEFAKKVRLEMRNFKANIYNTDDVRQVIRSSGSIGANYIEANEALSPKDFLYRVRVSRKEAKETVFWLKLLSETNGLNDNKEMQYLSNEAIELKKILSSIIEKSK
ncbi:MAG: four helix bundle protein [Reichenbachiella sp.]|uniref:four helix bundle protein n=1 Tax=Reichenbachiella sp. TaxID=2184521 RepID=UPI00326654D1